MKRFLGFLIAVMVFSGAFAQQRPSIHYHNTAITYNIGDLVSVSGILYKATASNTNDVPPSANWTQVTEVAGAETDPIYALDSARIAKLDYGGTFTEPIYSSGQDVAWDANLLATLGYLNLNYVPFTESGTAGETLVTGDMVYQTTDTFTWMKATNSNLDHVNSRMGIVATGGTVGQPVGINFDIIYTSSGTAGDILYLGVNGAITTTPPAGVNYARVIGAQMTATKKYINTKHVNYVKGDGSEVNGVTFSTGGGNVTATNSPVLNDFARWTSPTSIEGRTYAETRSDLGLVIGTNVQAYSLDLDNVSGTNTGDQTSIVGITGSIAEFNTALTGGDFATGGGTATGTNTGDNAVNSLYSGLVSNVTTNLGYTASPSNGIVTSSDGTDATITLATGTNAGLMTPAYFTNLANTSGTNTGDQDLSGYDLRGVQSTGVTAANYTTATADNGKHVVFTTATPTTITLDDATANIGDEYYFLNKTGSPMTFAYGTGDSAYQGALPTLGDGAYAFATLEATNSWSVSVPSTSGGSGTIGGTIADNQIAVGNGTDAIDGSGLLTWNGTTMFVTGVVNATDLDASSLDLGVASTTTGTITVFNSAGTNYLEVNGNAGAMNVSAFDSDLFIYATGAGKEVKTTNDPVTGDGVMNRDYGDTRYGYVKNYAEDGQEPLVVLGTGWADGTNSIVGTAATGTIRSNGIFTSTAPYTYSTYIRVSNYTSGTLTVKVGNVTHDLNITGNGDYRLVHDSTGQDDIFELIPVGSFTGDVTVIKPMSGYTQDDYTKQGTVEDITVTGFNNPISVGGAGTKTLSYDRDVPAILGSTARTPTADNFTGVMFINDTASTLALTVDGTYAPPLGFQFSAAKFGTGDITLTPTNGATINGSTGVVTITTQYEGTVQLIHVSGDDYLMVGKL